MFNDPYYGISSIEETRIPTETIMAKWLMVDILLQAAHDYNSGTSEEKEDAKKWFMSDGCDVMLEYKYICLMLGINADLAREKIFAGDIYISPKKNDRYCVVRKTFTTNQILKRRKTATRK